MCFYLWYILNIYIIKCFIITIIFNIFAQLKLFTITFKTIITMEETEITQMLSFDNIIKTIIKCNDDKIKQFKTSLETDFMKSFINSDCFEIYKLEYINSKLKTIKRSDVESNISDLEIQIKIFNKNGHIPCVASKVSEFLENESKKELCDIYKRIIRFY